MRFISLLFALTFAVGTTVALVQFDSPRTMPPTSRKRTFARAMSTYEYCESTNATLEDEKEILKRRMPAPVDKKMSKYQVEFRELLEGILYTEKEIYSILNPRMRAILVGIAASYYEPAVYRAFEILYDDYIPLRIAGRVVYRELRKVMDESKHYQQSQINAAMKSTGMLRSNVQDCWSTFIQIVNDQKLSLDELENYMGPQTLKYVLNSSSDSVGATAQEDGAISFEQLLVCLHNYSLRYNGDGSDESNNKIFNENPAAGNILQQALNLDDAIFTQKSRGKNLNAKRQKYNQRYDDMLIQFSKWKPLIPSGDGRRLQILKGCFVGSENPAVVEALRIIYVDYGALRLSGDWIFKVVSALMGPIVRKHERRQRQKKILKP